MTRCSGSEIMGMSGLAPRQSLSWKGHDMTSPSQSVPLCICGDPSCKIPYGYCHCGCGRKTTLSPFTCKKWLSVKGEPQRFIKGHQARIKPSIEYAKPFKIGGVNCRLIPLTQGKFAVVDEADYYWLMQWKWCVQICKKTGKYYAYRAEIVHGKTILIAMARQILGIGYGDTEKVDHVDPMATTDNRRKNIRPATQTENNRNVGIQKNNTSGYKGVSWSKAAQKWLAQITVDRVNIYLGIFTSKEEAYAVYCMSAFKYHGKFARVA